MLKTLAALILAQMVLHKPPGNSPYSFEAVPGCGSDPLHATCDATRPVCDRKGDFRCAPPRWSESRQAWVKVETREAGLKRYAALAEDGAAVIHRITRCTDEWGVADESCERAKWWRGGEDLGFVFATLGIFEAGLAEGPQGGHPPLGIGADGEVCMLGIMPEYAPPYAMWLPKKEREELTKTTRAEKRAWAMRELHGQANIRHCIEVSLREVVTARRRCTGDTGMFSSYASGSCITSAKTVPMRVSLLNKMRATKPIMPGWATSMLSPTDTD